MSKPNVFDKPEHLLARTTSAPNGCMEWNYSKTDRGYGHVSYKNKFVLAHRLMMNLIEPMPFENAIVMHKCDNPPCINPDHLSWGTLKQNSKDAYDKGRQKQPIPKSWNR